MHLASPCETGCKKTEYNFGGNKLEALLAEQSEAVTTAVEYEKVRLEKKPVYEAVKRVMDIFCSILALILLSWLFVIVTIVIMVDDFGNPFYSQMRTGKNGKQFKMYKFRTMYKDADARKQELMDKNESDGPLFKIADDPRITKIGRFLRNSSIDELPQLINIIKGDMAIIGPRPLITSEQDACNEYQKQRLLVKPGLSSYSVLEPKCREDFNYWIELDLKYIKERSFSTDVKIVLKTIKHIFKRKNH